MYVTKTKNSLKQLFPNFNQQIWGLRFEDINFDGMTWRGVHIKKTFYFKGRNTIGINEKFIKDCYRRGVTKLVVFVGEIPPYTEYLMPVPNKRMIKWLESQKHYEDKESKFEGAPSMRIYYFRI